MAATPQKLSAELQSPADAAATPALPVGKATDPQRLERLRSLRASIEEALNSNDPAMRDRILSEWLAQLIALDPHAATEYASEIEAGAFRDDYLFRLGNMWAQTDAPAALEWASTLSNETERASSIKAICLQLGQSDPAAAIQTMDSLKIPEDRGTIENLAQLWAAKDLDAAKAWALAKPEGESRDGSLARVAYVMANDSPSEAAQLVVNKIPPGEIQMEAAMSIIHTWARQDWQAVQQWVDRFPEGPFRDRAQAEIKGIQNASAGIPKAAAAE